MSALLEQLRETLAPQYEVERELASGGMGTVFLARDTVLDRKVAVKVVRPESDSETGAKRLLNEAKILARFSHPNVVSIIHAGELGESFYYIMEYVEGETLEERLTRGPLSAEEAVRIGSDVLSALEAAHKRGIVHRDVKPANIFLVEDRALLGDFGIAKRTETAATGLTESGYRVGTPGYMPPEQAAGDEVTAATDIYSLGMVLYEALSGRRWSISASMETADWSGVPQYLVPVLERALAWAPEERWRDSGSFRSALVAPAGDAVGRRSSFGRSLGRSAAVVTAVIALIVAALKLVPPLLSPTTLASAEATRIVLADFSTNTGDPDLAFAATEALRIDLSQSPLVRLVDRDDVQQVLARMEKDSVPLDYDLAREVAIREGIGAVISGEINRVGGSYLLSAQLVDAETGELIDAHRETVADTAEIIAAIDRLSDSMREQIGESVSSIRSSPPLEQVTTSSLPALRKYSQALRSGSLEKALALGEEALAFDSSFAAVWQGIALVLSGAGQQPARQVEAITRAYELRDRLTDRERYGVTADYHRMVTGDYASSSIALQNLLDIYPNDTEALNALGHLYRLYLREYQKAEEVLQRAVELDSMSVGSPVFNLGLVKVSLGKYDEAEALFDSLAKVFPATTDRQALGSLGRSRRWFNHFHSWLASARGDYDTAEQRARANLEAGIGDSPVWRSITNHDLAVIAQVRGRLAEAEGHYRDAIAAYDARLAANYLQTARRLAYLDLLRTGSPQTALRRMETALERYPLSELEPFDRPYLGLASLYAEVGRPGMARQLVTEFEIEIDTILQRRSRDGYHRARGLIALAEGRNREAIAEFRMQDDASGCAICALPGLAMAYQMAGEPDSAIAVYERYVTTPHHTRVFLDSNYLASIYERLGLLHEQQGGMQRAIHYYGKLIDLWKDADPELQPRVEAARSAIEALSSDQ